LTGNAYDVHPNLLSLLSLYSPTSNRLFRFLKRTTDAVFIDKVDLLWLMYNHLRVNTYGAARSCFAI